MKMGRKILLGKGKDGKDGQGKEREKEGKYK